MLSSSLARFRVDSSPDQVQAGVKAEISVTLHREDTPNIVGRVVAELIISLRDTYPVIEHYTLSYRLSGTIIGNPQLVESLAPTAPYIPQPRLATPPKRKIKSKTHGQRLSFRSNVAYVVPLPGFDIPSNLREALVERTREEQEDELASRLGGGVAATLETHGKYWSTLLYVEELQVEYVRSLLESSCIVE